MDTIKLLPKVGEVIQYTPKNDITTLAYVVNRVNNTYYLYTQNRLVAIEVQHTIEDDPITGDLIDKYSEISTNEICDYCIIPEADYILKRD